MASPPKSPETGSPRAITGPGIRTGAVWLARDPIVLGFLSTSAVFAVLLGTSILPPGARHTVGDTLVTIVGMTWACLAAIYQRRWIDRPRERGFWALVLTGFALWLAGLLVYQLPTTLLAGPTQNRAADFLFLASYLPLLLAIASRPDLDAEDRPTRYLVWLSAIGSFILLTGWIIYAVGLPVAQPGPLRAGEMESWLVFPVLDTLVVINLVVIASQTTVRRWRVIWSALAIALFITLLLNVLDILVGLDLVVRDHESLQSLLWIAPAAAFVAATRLRHLPVPVARGPIGLDWRSPDQRFVLGIAPLLGAFSFPFVHLMFTLAGVEQPDAGLQQLVVVGSMLSMGLLAFLAYRFLEAQRQTWAAEQEALRRAASQSQRLEAVGRLADGLAHEFNNLITAIGGSTELALEHLDDGDLARASLEETRKAAGRAAAIAERLARRDDAPVAHSLTLNVSEAAGAMRGTLSKLVGPGVVMDWKLDREIWHAKIDRSRFEQLLMNLAVNARDAMPDGGTLTIATARVTVDGDALRDWPRLTAGDYVRLEVRDTGTGITPDVLPRIFDPFFTTKRAGQGTGLGLSLVQSIVADAGGRIRVGSEPGAGSAFTVLLPRTSPAPAPTRRDERLAEAAPGDATVLIVEDEAAVLSLTTTFLARSGYRVIAATSGEDALRVSDGFVERIDLLLTDVIMPGMTGRELADAMVGRRPGLAVLFMTGYAGHALDLRGAAMGSRRVLQKPFTAHALVQAVRDTLEDHGHRTGVRGPVGGES